MRRCHLRYGLLVVLTVLCAAVSARAAEGIVTRIDSVAMTVGDMDRALPFSTMVLPFEVVSDVEVSGDDYARLFGVFGMRARIVRLRLGDEHIELVDFLVLEGRPIPVDSRSNDLWLQHVAIIVSDVNAAYEHLRRRVIHLSWLWQTRNLFITRIPVGDDGQARAVLTNYDLQHASREELERLRQRQRGPRADLIWTDVASGFPGDDYPLKGFIELRSFKAIVGFLGRGISEEPERAVPGDERAGDAGFNPVATIGIRETESRPEDAIFAVEERGLWYSLDDPLDDPALGRWNRQAFDVLCQLFQSTVTDVGRTQTPAITIAK